MTEPSKARFAFEGQSRHRHELNAIKFALRALADYPSHLWTFFEFQGSRAWEVDLLVLGERGVYHVELKEWNGRFHGSDKTWCVNGKDRRSPHGTAEQKSKELKTKLQESVESLGRRRYVPQIHTLIFLTGSEHRIDLTDLTPDGSKWVVKQSSFKKAICQHDFPLSSPSVPLTPTHIETVLRGMEKIGVKPWPRQVTDNYEIVRPIEETVDAGDGADGNSEGTSHGGDESGTGSGDVERGYQDYLVKHLSRSKSKLHIARVYRVFDHHEDKEERLRAAANREDELLARVGGHPGVLRCIEFVDLDRGEKMGPTLIFDEFEGGQTLDRFRRMRPELPQSASVKILRQIAEALAHCHENGVVHGDLYPRSVLIRERDGEIEVRLRNFALGGSSDIAPTTHNITLLSSPAAALYRAPERFGNRRSTVAADCFSLGCLAFFLLTGEPPAKSPPELRTLLSTKRCLDPRMVDPSIPRGLCDAVRSATAYYPRDRVNSVRAWIDRLLAVTQERPNISDSPLAAGPGDLLAGRYRVERVLGKGETSVVLRVLDEASDDSKDDETKERSYALKVSADAEFDPLLREEARVLQSVRNERIVQCLGERNVGGRPCLLLALAGDMTLRRRLDEEGAGKPLPFAEVERCGDDLLAALEALERGGHQHRDVKPENIGVGTTKGGDPYAVLFDFSLAAKGPSTIELGSKAYKDPELKLGSRGRWDAADDRWSAAITLYEMLTGSRPAEGDLQSDRALELALSRHQLGTREHALVSFFKTALARTSTGRFPNAKRMRHEWNECWIGRPSFSTAPNPQRSTEEAPPVHPTLLELGRLQELWAQTVEGAPTSLVDMTSTVLKASRFLAMFFQMQDRQETSRDEAARAAGLAEVLNSENRGILLVVRGRRLDESFVRGALRKLLGIATVCRSQVPDLWERLSFRIGDRWSPSSAELQQLDPRSLVADGDLDLWNAFLERLDTTPERPELEDFGLRLRLYLWQAGVRSAPQVVKDCTNLLLSGFGQDPRRVSTRLASEIDEIYAKGSPKPRFELPRPSDVAIGCAPTPRLAVGRRWKPTLRDLTDGQLRERPQVFGRLWATFEDWLTQVREGFGSFGPATSGPERQGLDENADAHLDDRKLSVFWIESRAGDGQSALLLQLIAKLVQQLPSVPLVHLKSVREFGELVQGLSRVSLSPGDGPRIFAAVDDVFRVQNREELFTLVHEACAQGAPRVGLLTCGPVEERQAWERELRDELSIRPFAVPALERAEMEEFALWYGKPTDLKNVTVKNTVLAWFLWELSLDRPLRDVAARVKQRLRTAGIFEGMRNVLAVMALNLEPPMELIEPTKDPSGASSREAALQVLEKLNDDDLLPNQVVRSEGIVRVASEAAWRFLGEWARSEDELHATWASGLAKALAVFGSRADTRPRAIALLTALYQTPRLGEAPSLRSSPLRNAVIQAVYRAYLDECLGAPQPTTLAGWLRLADTVPGLELAPSPAEYARTLLAELKLDDQLAPLVAKWLWRYAEPRQAALGRAPLQTARDYFEMSRDDPQALKELAELCLWGKSPTAYALALEWIDQDPAHPRNQHLLCSLRKPDIAEEAVRRAVTWLGHEREPEQVYSVLATLLPSESSAPLVEPALVWVDRNPEHPKVDSVMEFLATRHLGHPLVGKRLIDWVLAHPGHARGPRMVRELLSRSGAAACDFEQLSGWLDPRQPGSDAMLRVWAQHRRQAEAWLDQNQSHEIVPYLLAALVQAWHHIAPVRVRTLAWVSSSRDKLGACEVLLALLRIDKGGLPTQDRDEALEIGVDWLSRNLRHQGAADVLNHLVFARRGDPSVSTLVQGWLRENAEDRKGTARLLALLVQDRVSWALEASETWLDANPDREESHVLVDVMIDQPGTRSRGIERAAVFVARHPQQSKVPLLLAKACSVRPDDEELFLRAMGWLEANRPHAGRHLLVERILPRWRTHPQFLAQAMSVLDSCQDSAIAESVASVLFEDERGRVRANVENAELVGRFVDWVERRRDFHGSFKLIRAVAKVSANCEAAQKFVRDWIDGHPDDERRWSIAGYAIYANHGAPEWIELGDALLAADVLPDEARHVFGSLLHSTEASPRYVERALEFAKRISTKKSRDGLRGVIGRALVLNPKSAREYLKAHPSRDGQPLSWLYRHIGRAIDALGEPDGVHRAKVDEFLAMLERDVSKADLAAVLLGAVSEHAGIHGNKQSGLEALDRPLGRWLLENKALPSYPLFIAELRKRSKRWAKLLALTEGR